MGLAISDQSIAVGTLAKQLEPEYQTIDKLNWLSYRTDYYNFLVNLLKEGKTIDVDGNKAVVVDCDRYGNLIISRYGLYNPDSHNCLKYVKCTTIDDIINHDYSDIILTQDEIEYLRKYAIRCSRSLAMQGLFKNISLTDILTLIDMGKMLFEIEDELTEDELSEWYKDHPLIAEHPTFDLEWLDNETLTQILKSDDDIADCDDKFEARLVVDGREMSKTSFDDIWMNRKLNDGEWHVMLAF